MKTAFLSFFCFVVLFSLSVSAGDWRKGVSPADGSLVSLAFGNETFVAVGDTIVYANDPDQWNESVQGKDYLLRQVIHAEDRFYAVGRTIPIDGEDPEPRILTSQGGEIWSAASLPEFPYPTIEVRSIAYRNGIWIAVTWPRAIVLRSEDGRVWDVVEELTQKSLDQVVATDDGFTIFSNGEIYESSSGLEWSARWSGSVEQSTDQIAFGNGRFLGRDSTGAWSSLDGSARLYFDSPFSAIGYADGLFAKLNESKMLLSADLGDWGAFDVEFGETPRAVAASGDSIVVVGDAGMIRILDGGWAPVITSEPTTDRHVYSAGSRLSLRVGAVGSGTLMYQWSKDGKELPGEKNSHLVIDELSVADAGTYSVRISNGRGTVSTRCEVRVASEATLLSHELSWQHSDSAPAVQPDALSYGKGRFLGVKSSRPTTVVHSRSGSGYWGFGQFRDFQSFTFDRTFIGDQFIISGIDGFGGPTILFSPDGAVWARALLPEGLVGPIFSVAWGNGIYLATTGIGWILRSEDGREWERVGDGRPGRTIAFGNGYFLQFLSSTIYRSVDGEKWEEQHANFPYLSPMDRLLFEGQRWWAIGSHTETMQSLDGKAWLEVDGLRMRDLISVNGVLVSAGDDGIRYSHGAEWSIPIPPHSAISVVAYGDGRIVAVGDGFTMVRSIEIAPVIAIQPKAAGGNDRAIGSEVTLFVGAVGSGTLHYQWFKDGNPLWGENSPVLRITNLTAHRAGTYRVEIWNEAGGAQSEEISIHVRETPRPVIPVTTLPELTLSLLRGGIAWGNDRFVAANHGRFSTSLDGLSWSSSTILGVTIYSSMIFDGEQFLIGGYSATARSIILRSTDGFGWAESRLSEEAIGPVFSMAYGDGIYVASVPNGIFRSTDGETWNRIPDSGVDGYLTSLAYGDGWFLGSNGRSIFHSADGREWNIRPGNAQISGELSFLQGRWWLKIDDRELYQSMDGSRWFSTGLDFAGEVTVVDGLLIVPNGNQTIVGNGADWGTADLGFPPGGHSSIIEAGGRLLFISESGARVRDRGIPPAITMQPTALIPQGSGTRGLTWVGGRQELKVHAVGSGDLKYQWFFNDTEIDGQTGPQLVLDEIQLSDVGDYRVAVSNPYGIAWSDAVTIIVSPNPPVDSPIWSGPTGVSLQDVVFGNGRFVGFNQNAIYQSRDGISWRGGKTLGNASFENIFFEGGKFIATTPQGGSFFSYSADGAAWSTARLPDGVGQMRSVAWGNGVFVASVYNGTLLSEDGIDWEMVRNEPDLFAYGNGFFLGVDRSDSVWKSTDGRKWNPLAPSPLRSIREIQFVEGRFFLLGSRSGIAHSTDGITWELLPEFPPIERILASEGVLVAAGVRGGVSYGTLDARHWTSFQTPPFDLPQAVGNGRVVSRSHSDGTIVRSARIEPHLAAHPEGFVAAAAGESTEIDFTPIGNPPFTYSWYREDNWIADTEEPVLEIPNASQDDEGIYRLLITSSAGATFSDPITLYVQAPPRIISQPGTVFVNPGETVRLAIAVQNGDPASYEWIQNGSILATTAEPAYEIKGATAADAGDYIVTVSNAAGSTSSQPIHLHVILEYADWIDWRISEGDDPETLAPNADLTGSGIPNLLRYALNLSAGNPRAGLPRVSMETDSEDPSRKILTFTFQRRKEANDLRLSVETSPELSDWSELKLSEADVSVEDAGALEIVTLRYPLDNSAEKPAKFFRLAVEKEEVSENRKDL